VFSPCFSSSLFIKTNTVDKDNRRCPLRETTQIKEGYAAAGNEKCPSGTENPWNRLECGKSPPTPQIKQLGNENIIYCRGHKIK
jgi:hypothetical protein